MHDNSIIKVAPDPATDPLRDLMHAMAGGDRQAFEKLYRLTSPRLFAVALRMLRRHAWAEEVLHDSFITAWNRASSYNGALSSPMTWLTHIVRNRAIDWMRGSDNQLAELDENVADRYVEQSDEPLQRLQQDSDAKILAN